MRDQIRRTATYIYINIYTRNLKFAQLVTALASLANKDVLKLSFMVVFEKYRFNKDNFFKISMFFHCLYFSPVLQNNRL